MRILDMPKSTLSLRLIYLSYFKTMQLGCSQCKIFTVINGGALATSYYCIVRFIRNFSLPFLLLGDVLRGHLQHGQIYPS